MTQPHAGVAVIGAGITGLAAAYELVRGGAPGPVTVFEADEEPGGKIRGAVLAGRRVEAGPDAFLARVPDAVELCRELDLGDELVSPAAGEAWVWSGSRLRRLPGELVLGVPSDLAAVARSGILSAAGMARAAADLVLPRDRWPDDVAVGTVVGRRFGRQTVDRLVDPLLGGIHAGDANLLSLDATAAPLAGVARRERSLLLGLRRMRRTVSLANGPAAGGPVFLAPRPGMGHLVSRLVEEVGKGADFRTACPVAKLVDTGGAGGGARYRLETPAGPLDADAVIVALPAGPAASLLEPLSPAAASELRAIRHASVAIALLAFPAPSFSQDLPGSGVLVPRAEGRLMTACSCGSAKWPHWAEPGVVVLRVSAGRVDDTRIARMDDGEILARLRAEVRELLGVDGAPLDQQLVRWPDAFPQYEVGHQARVGRIEAALAHDAPGIAVAGGPYRGIGIPACIAQGRAAARRLTCA
jgi:oxygen-dependent protoporphyrinogen oxidase